MAFLTLPTYDPIALEPPPAWQATPALSADDYRERFEHTGPNTIGLEEELMLIDPATLGLAPFVEEVLAAFDGDSRFTRELRRAQLELTTVPCHTVGESCEELRETRADLVERLAGQVRIAAAGTHPVSTDWGELSEGERYRQLIEEYTWMGLHGLPCGLHVHVAVGGAERTLAVYNAMRSYLPEIGALAANSPFLAGQDTGLASIRLKLTEQLPRAGIPPEFPTWEDLAEFVAWGRRGGLFPDMRHFWWDLRLHPGYGTLELRVADAQPSMADVGAVAALFQSLVAHLAERWDAGERLPVHPTHWIRENAWRGLRYGVHGIYVDLDTGRPTPIRERLSALNEELAPAARRLGCEDELLGGQALLAGNGADRQRYVADREGFDGLVRWLVEETEGAAADQP
jgi:carboxylate-amine ligase